MGRSAPSALISDKGKRVQLRVGGRFYSLSQQSLRELLDLPDLSITIGGDQLHFEFASDDRAVTISAAQLGRRLVKLPEEGRFPCLSDRPPIKSTCNA